MMSDNILPILGEAYYFPGFFDEAECSLLFDRLAHGISWKQEPIYIFGKKVMQPRLTALYGDPQIDYGYSGIQMSTLEWTDTLRNIKERIEPLAKVDFTHVLLNYYRDGNDSMGWHRDNEKVLGQQPVIASVSFGTTRKFQFRLYQEKNRKILLDLSQGSYLLMKGNTQQNWEHQVPKTAQKVGPRINLTFRVIRKS